MNRKFSKIKVFVFFLLLGFGIVGLFIASPARSMLQMEPSYSGYLPVVLHLPTLTPTPIPASIEPIKSGGLFRFIGANSRKFEGKVISSEFQSSLQPKYGNAMVAKGVYVVVIMDFTNMGLESGFVSGDSFRVQDSAGRLFDMAPFSVQSAAADQYNLSHYGVIIQPGFTERVPIVFDVLPQSTSLQLVPRYPW